MTITEKIGPGLWTWTIEGLGFNGRLREAHDGETVSVTVEQHGAGGELECRIFLDAHEVGHTRVDGANDCKLSYTIRG